MARGDLSVPCLRKILLDSNPLENLFKKLWFICVEKDSCCQGWHDLWDLQMEVQVVHLQSAWRAAPLGTIALRCWRREGVFGTSSPWFPPALYYWGISQAGQGSLAVCAVLITHKPLYGLVVAALLWKMGVLIVCLQGTMVVDSKCHIGVFVEERKNAETTFCSVKSFFLS